MKSREAIVIRLEAITTRVEAIAINLNKCTSDIASQSINSHVGLLDMMLS